jgi:polar amino acid transport system substrate-binding protein
MRRKENAAQAHRDQAGRLKERNPMPGLSFTVRRVAGLALSLATALASAAPLVIAVEDDWPPFATAEREGGERVAKGLAVELVRAAFETQGIEVQFQPVPFARCMLLARSSRVLGCFNATQTLENRGQYLWHEPPMFVEELAIYGRQAGLGRDLAAADLRGRRVGVTNGYTYPTSVMQDPAIERHTATSDAALLRMLAADRVDYILINHTPAQLRLQADATLRAAGIRRVGRISLDGFWLAFSIAHPQGAEMAARFGDGLQRLRRNGQYPAGLQAP